MVTLNDLERDFPEAYMNFRKTDSQFEDMEDTNDRRESSIFTKSGGIIAFICGANKNKGNREEFDKSESN